jgi:hypothetical protein
MDYSGMAGNGNHPIILDRSVLLFFGACLWGWFEYNGPYSKAGLGWTWRLGAIIITHSPAVILFSYIAKTMDFVIIST